MLGETIMPHWNLSVFVELCDVNLVECYELVDEHDSNVAM
jgi:hypothetical protein